MKLFRIDLEIRLGGMISRGDTYIVIAEDKDKARKRIIKEFDFYEWEFLDAKIVEIDSIDGYDIVVLEHDMINQIENDRYNKKQSYGFDYEKVSGEDYYDYGWGDAISTVEDLLKVNFE